MFGFFFNSFGTLFGDFLTFHITLFRPTLGDFCVQQRGRRKGYVQVVFRGLLNALSLCCGGTGFTLVCYNGHEDNKDTMVTTIVTNVFRRTVFLCRTFGVNN